jgi:hypothetical protein
MRTKIYCLSLILLIVAADMLAGQPEKPNEKLNKVTAVPTWTRFNINNISTVFTADGRSDNYTDTKKPAFEYPKGSSKYLFYQSGLIWGGKVLHPDTMQIRVTGSAYRTAMMPGHVINGVPVDTSVNDRARIFRVRPDYATADLTSEVNSGEGTEAMVRAQYEKDWNEWPAELGAPYQDLDENGVYDPAVDIPGVKEADQTIWFVCNDLYPPQAELLYGSYPLGVEMQATIWGYKREGALGNTLFRKYVLINKSGKDIEEMYVSMWSDPDCGDGTDDFVGIDKEKNLMYVYNGKANDAIYGYTPPAGGFDLLQGPIVDAPGETGIFMGKKVANKKNLPVTGTYYFINQNEVYSDPGQGSYQDGTLQFWNLLRGKIGTTGDDYPVPGGGVTNFPLDGDPLIRAGYIDGLLFPPGDRRIGMASGPFTFAVGDTQEVVLAQIAAGASGETDRLGAVNILRQYDLLVQNTYNNSVGIIGIESDEPSAPTRYDLSQNYPNPFNPSTTINFAVPKAGNVKITVYDMLGREVEILTNKEYSVGVHKIEWNASRYSSGVYFYKLESAGFSMAKKMLLIK